MAHRRLSSYGTLGAVTRPATPGSSGLPAPSGRIQRPAWRARAVRALAVGILVGQAALLIRGYWDPHAHFGFQPFPESSTWRADIVRVTADGRRISIDEPWPGGYDWDRLVRWRVLQHPERRKHAYSSLDATVDFLDEALDWVAEHTPADTETVRLEARVEGRRNTRGPVLIVLRSDDRDEAR